MTYLRDDGTVVQQRHRVEGECLAESLQQRHQGPLAAQDAAGNGRQGLCFGAGLCGLAGRAGGGVDDPADGDRDRHEDGEGEQVLALGDGEPADRRGEVVVQQQRAGHGGEQG
nr:hypothetical protein GCM10020092_052440 [Actinoplanes digitatis]